MSATTFMVMGFVVGIIGRCPRVFQFRYIAFTSQYSIAPGELVVVGWWLAFDESVLQRLIIGKIKVVQG